MRRDAFSPEEYRKLHTVGRSWVKAANRPSSDWYRTVAYNFVLIMCNTGMRPSEAKNLCWCDVTIRKDREARDVAVLRVSGKGKTSRVGRPGQRRRLHPAHPRHRQGAGAGRPRIHDPYRRARHNAV